MLHQVNFQEDPALADLGTLDFTRGGLDGQRDRMNLEEVGGLLQSECVHVVTSRNKPSLRSDREQSR